MKIMTLILSVTTLLSASTSFSEYTTTGATDGFNVIARAATSLYYTDPTDGASDISYPAVTLDTSGDWAFTFNDDGTVSFTGNVYQGDYETQTNITGFPNIDGHQQYQGVNQALSGTGAYDDATHTFSFTIAPGNANSGEASTQTQISSSCVNGRTSIFGNVCDAWSSANPSWEGVTLNFVFSEDRTSFTGTISAVDKSGQGLSENTTIITFNVSGTMTDTTPIEDEF